VNVLILTEFGLTAEHKISAACSVWLLKECR